MVFPRRCTVVVMSSYNAESDSESVNSDTEYLDRVHECLKYVPIYGKGAFSCSSCDDYDDDGDDDDDEDVKRILMEHGEPETEDYKTEGFSPAYKTAAAVATTDLQSTDGPRTGATDDKNDYNDWDDALKDVSTVYPPLGVSVTAFVAESRRLEDVTLDFCTGNITDGEDHCRGLAASSSARELRKCLEGALYGQDIARFVVAQPFCVANKNLDFGKPIMSHKAMLDSRRKVENWMKMYTQDENRTTSFHNK